MKENINKRAMMVLDRSPELRQALAAILFSGEEPLKQIW